MELIRKIVGISEINKKIITKITKSRNIEELLIEVKRKNMKIDPLFSGKDLFTSVVEFMPFFLISSLIFLLQSLLQTLILLSLSNIHS